MPVPGGFQLLICARPADPSRGRDERRGETTAASQRQIRGSSLADRDSLLRRLHELRSEHRDLDTVIARLDEAGADALQLQRLKKRKLKLKDEIAWLESRLVPDIIA
jgi:hypothetical protein